jgi:hypothetical protein
MAQNSSSADTSSLSGLLSTTPASLSDWYGDPLAKPVAGALLAQLRTRQQSCLRAGIPCFQLQVLAIICHGWLGSEAEFGYEQLVALAADAHERALLELVQGQLLASRKCLAAMGHLQQGFRLAAPLLASDGYFELVRRHELLGYLFFSEKPSAPQNLASLLNEAAVINRLRTGERRHYAAGHLDTVG